ncbi:MULTISPECIES: Cof-type HAD-IIB family hydrolase [Clostridium]|uniref:HAD superfamily hydrolase n=2 Tax=Clostridium butyricum TaxID=1492 RepID=C4IIE9_CLOBU|nr:MULTISPECIES: Cof-type HAD-IIB family hydrolase [Clostridium]ALP90308.1 hydrolase [Clostridium butyricum]ALS16762.1 hydrolase [Clostridium butyricum]ANF13925.1 hydrolase [Clostridium butyricum]AOR93993.1 hydrolase [Clostridium butyricum]APF24154.1 Cof-like hydrolase family protein [Clostridium butyricum]
MNNKVIFLDVDGTLCNDEGFVPESAKEAVRSARKNGHKVYLCTGRSKAEIYDFIMEIGFDGVIGAGGGYLQIEDNMVYHKRVSHSNVRHLVDFFNKHNVNFYIESNGGLYASENLIPQLERCIYGDIDNDIEARERKEKNPHHFIEGLITGEDLYRDDVNKACFLEPDGITFEEIKKEFENEFEVYRCTVEAFGENSGELGVPGVHKATAIDILLKCINARIEDTIALGDGMNDAEMLKFCNVGIAMGNAKEGLKKIADEITDTHDEGGIYRSFIKHGLI